MTSRQVIDEFSRIEEIKGQRIKNVLSAAKPRRQVVARAELKFRSALRKLGYVMPAS